jgi:hypothetical protein
MSFVRKLSVFVLVVSLCSTSFAFGGRRRATGGASVSNVSTEVGTGETATAQGVANIMARVLRVGHWGGNRGYEGCGMASTKEGAYGICCYANSGMATVDVGYAQGANGMWFCCRRYR